MQFGALILFVWNSVFLPIAQAGVRGKDAEEVRSGEAKYSSELSQAADPVWVNALHEAGWAASPELIGSVIEDLKEHGIKPPDPALRDLVGNRAVFKEQVTQAREVSVDLREALQAIPMRHDITVALPNISATWPDETDLDLTPQGDNMGSLATIGVTSQKNAHTRWELKPPDGQKELAHILRQVSSRTNVSFRQLHPEEGPVWNIRNNRYALDAAFLLSSYHNRILGFGDGHGLIMPLLAEAVDRAIVELPIKQILNIDFHADVAEYGPEVTMHTASWQRFGVYQGFWKTRDSFNWQPARSTAMRPTAFSIPIDDQGVTALNPEILSIDLDFFNHLSLHDAEFSRQLEIVNQLARKAKAVFIFSSSGWQSGLSEETIKKAVEEIKSSFLSRELLADQNHTQPK